jgi:hypothetical protein
MQFTFVLIIEAMATEFWLYNHCFLRDKNVMKVGPNLVGLICLIVDDNQWG